ncbi:MAG: hypothetical protein RLZZ543_967 [Bacteroidota bacterium]|jgi:hypothetical protein
MQEDLYKWYKESAESLPHIEPPPMVWENVTAVLDNKGAQKKRFGFWWWTAGALVVLLLSGLFLRQQFPEQAKSNATLVASKMKPEQIIKGTSSTNATSVQTHSTSDEKPSELRKESLSEQSANTNTQKENALVVGGTERLTEENANPVFTPESYSVSPSIAASSNKTSTSILEEHVALNSSIALAENSDKLNSLNAPDLSTVATEQSITSDLAELPLSIVPKEKPVGSLWYFGLASEFNNNYLLNRDLIDALRKESNNSLLPHFSSTWAFMGAKSYAPGKAIRVEVLISKTNGQHYLTYSEGVLQKKTIHLDYSGASILYDKTSNKSMRLFGMPVRTHWQLGPEVCVLGATSLAVGTNNLIPVEYRKLNVSLIGGLEEELFLSNQFSVAGGIRLNAGMTNIFKGFDNVPAYFNRTHTGNMALTVNLRYYLRMPK